MKHRKDDVSLEQLSNHLRLEEEYRKQDDTKEQSAHANLHVMEDEKSNKPNKKRYQNFNKSQGNNGDFRKNKKKRNCFHCEKLGHFKKECRFLRKKKEKNDTAIKDNLIAVISEINMIEDIGSWWIDSGVTRHVCKNRDFFKTFKEENGIILYMGNASTVQVMGKGTVKLEFTSGRVLTLTDVYYVPEVRKNLVFVPLLNKYAFKSVFEGGKFILSKGGVFVGKGYLCENMFKLNIVNTINNNNVSVYIAESFDLWHNRLRHNGIAERKNRVLEEMVNAMLSYSGLAKVIESRDAIFLEDRFNSTPRPESKIHLEKEENVENKPVENIELRKSKRIRKAKTYGPDFFMFLVEGTGESKDSIAPICLHMEGDTETYEEAIRFRDSDFWKEAIQDKMDSIMRNNTWKLVDLPRGSKAISSKWIFKKKMKVDGTVDKFKARLVAKGFAQKEGIDYFDTYAPVARIATIRVLIALASIFNFVIHQMDVKTTFLNGELDEEVYMKQPEGFIVAGQKNKVCKLVKSLYGLKQAPKQWHKKFDETIRANGCKINESDKCVYSKVKNGKCVMICLYVDDMLIFGTDLEEGEPSVLEGYTDASWISYTEDHASTSGWIFTLGGVLFLGDPRNKLA
ncbi:uncharacterized protein [Arachis hypogaea]|uniref:uncharacterized protein n=1 Tax=Arachis hypogaea TaxID=3818 RepID=UPI003B228DD4